MPDHSAIALKSSDTAVCLSFDEHTDPWRRSLLDDLSHLLRARRRPRFNNLVRALPGVDPLVVRSLLEEMTGMPQASIGLVQRARAAINDSASPAVSSHSNIVDPMLPAPHPLDYEWRFTQATRDLLIGKVLESRPRSVLLLGCPTIALGLLSSRETFRITLVDDNPALPLLAQLIDEPGRWNSYVQRRVDLIADPGATSGVEADVIVADAPFYNDAMTGFLLAAAHGGREGTLLHYVLPPSGARPTADTDAVSVVEQALGLDFKHIGTEVGRVRYLRPQFEAKAHAAAGLLSIDEDWRTANLGLFELVSPPVSQPGSSTSDRGLWQEVSVGGKRWRVRSGSSDPQVVEGLLVGSGGSLVLDSVSRRDVRREQTNVCTDDNEFFSSSNPTALLEVLRCLLNDFDPVAQIEKSFGRALSTTEYTEVGLVVDTIRAGATNGMRQDA